MCMGKRYLTLILLMSMALGTVWAQKQVASYGFKFWH